MPKFQAELASLVKLSGQVAVDALAGQLTAFVREHVLANKPPNQPAQQGIDVSLVRFCCNLVECTVKKRTKTDEKVNKKELVKTVYQAALNTQLDSERLRQLDVVIEDLHSSGAIRGVTLWRWLRKNISRMLKKGFA